MHYIDPIAIVKDNTLRFVSLCWLLFQISFGIIGLGITFACCGVFILIAH